MYLQPPPSYCRDLCYQSAPTFGRGDNLPPHVRDALGLRHARMRRDTATAQQAKSEREPALITACRAVLASGTALVDNLSGCLLTSAFLGEDWESSPQDVALLPPELDESPVLRMDIDGLPVNPIFLDRQTAHVVLTLWDSLDAAQAEKFRARWLDGDVRNCVEKCWSYVRNKAQRGAAQVAKLRQVLDAVGAVRAAQEASAILGEEPAGGLSSAGPEALTAHVLRALQADEAELLERCGVRS